MTNIAKALVESMRSIIAADPLTYFPELYTDYKYINNNDRICHPKTIKLIRQAASRLNGITPSTNETVLFKAKMASWRPDVILSDSQGKYLLVVEYESLCSSDSRIIQKDIYGYEKWTAGLKAPVPLLIISTMPNYSAPKHKLLSSTGFNLGLGDFLSEIKRNPLVFWYGYYRRWAEHRIANLPVSFANFSGNTLEYFEKWPAESMAYEPKFDDGSCWGMVGKGKNRVPKWPATQEVFKIRTDYKKALWETHDTTNLKNLLHEYREKEQVAWGEDRWGDEADVFFYHDVEHVQNREEACKRIERVQWNRY